MSSESKDVKALRILRLQGMDRQFEIARDHLRAAMEQLDVPSEDMGLINEILQSFTDPSSVAEFKEIFAPSYSARFSEQEMDELIDMMGSPVYQKFLETQPEITREVMEESLNWAHDRMMPILERLGIDPDLFAGPWDDPEEPGEGYDDYN